MGNLFFYYGLTFRLWLNFIILSDIGFLSMWNWISSHVKLDFFQCKVRFLLIWHYISSNVKLDFFICKIGFFPIWNWISSKAKFYFFQCEIGFLLIKLGLLLIWNRTFITVKLDFFLILIVWQRLGFNVLTWTHGIGFRFGTKLVQIGQNHCEALSLNFAASFAHSTDGHRWTVGSVDQGDTLWFATSGPPCV